MIDIVRTALISILATGPACSSLSNGDTVKSNLRDGPKPVVMVAVEIAAQRLFVIYDIHIGFRFRKPENTEFIIPEFSSQQLKEYFQDYFSEENMPKIVGKRVVCNCEGTIYRSNGRTYFRVDSATLSAEDPE